MAIVSGTEGYRAVIADSGATRFNDVAALGTETFVTFSYLTSFPTYATAARANIGSTTLETITAEQRAAIRAALDKYSAISGITFIEVPADSAVRSDITFGMVADIPSYSGLAYFPYEGINRSTDSLAGEVWLSKADVGAMTVGTWGNWVVMHEIGHSIGFKHTFEGTDTLIASEDNTNFSVMSYNVSPVPTQLGPYDVQAAQYLYGSRTAANANAITGSYDAATNRVWISGGAASETILGTGYQDSISGGAGNDVVQAGSGNDIVSGGDGNDTLSASNGDDTLIGGSGNDTLIGSSGSDVVVLSRPRWEYKFVGSSSTLTATGLTSAASSADGLDTLSGIEFIEAGGVRFSTATAVGNNLANATATGITSTAGARRALSDFFTVSDPDGHAITSYRLVDRTAGGGRLVRVVGGVETDLSAAGTTTLTAAELSSVFFEGGTAAGTDVIEVGLYDGREWSQPTISITTTGAVVNRAPLIAAGATTSVNVGSTIAASSLFTVSDPDGNAITGYEFRDAAATGGSLRLSGASIGNGIVAITPAQLANLTYAAGSAAGSETIEVRATDGALWSSWLSVSVSTLQPNRAPLISAGATTSVNVGSSITASSLFTVSDPDGNPITGYEFRDAAATGGSLRLSGASIGNGIVAITPAQLANLTYAAGSAAGSETIEVRATDGALWSSWLSVSVSTLQPNRAPVVAAGATTSVAASGSIAASSLFTVSDPDGNAITGYEFRDANAAGGSLRLSGVNAGNGVVAVTAAQLGSLTYVGGGSAGTETIEVRATDGALWSDWLTVNVSTLAPTVVNAVPVINPTGLVLSTNQWATLNTLFTATDPDGTAISAYRFTDLSAGNGYLWMGGVTQAAGATLEVTASQLASVYFRGSDVGGATDTLRIEAFDGTAWGTREIAITTTANRIPVVTAQAGASTSIGASIPLSSIFSITDPDGDAITAYEIVDGTGSGVFKVGGTTVASNVITSLTPAQFANTVYVGGSVTGTDTLWLRAKDSLVWSNWTSYRMPTTLPTESSVVVINNPPIVSAGSVSSVNVGASIAASSLFSAVDPDGNAITGYEFRDASAGGGSLLLSGASVGNGTVAITPAQLASLTYAGGSAAGSETIEVRATDGKLWSNWLSVSVATLQPNRAPLVSAGSVSSVAAGSSVAAASLFSVSDPDGNPITGYEFRDASAGGGSLLLSGSNAGNGVVAISAAQLANLTYVGGATAGAESIEVRATDGALWSAWLSVSVSTVVTNRPPVIGAGTASSVDIGASIAASSLFSVSDPDGNAITSYEFRDANAGGGSLRLGGTSLGNGIVSISSAQLANLTYASGNAAGSETIEVRATDGSLWSNWLTVSVATIQPNRAPLIAVGSTSSVVAGSSISAGALFSVSDPDGNAITGYEFRDANSGGGSLRLSGTSLGNGIVAITPAQIANLSYVGGSTAGSETIEIRATDGSLWSSWLSVSVTTTAPPVVNSSPIVSQTTSFVTTNQWAQLSTLFTATDPDGGTISAYRFTDLSAGNGYLWMGGITQAVGTPLEVAASQLSSIWYRGGATSPGTDTLRIEAFDGTSWGSRDIVVSTISNRVPIVVPNVGATVTAGSSIPISSIFAVSDPDGDAIRAYEIVDSGSGGGFFRVGGVAQASGTAISLTPAQLAAATYVGGSAAGSETIWLRASDSVGWSNWTSYGIKTQASLATHDLDGIPDNPEASPDLDTLANMFDSADALGGTANGGTLLAASSGGGTSPNYAFMASSADTDRGVLAGGLR